MRYFPTNRGAKEPQDFSNHRVAILAIDYLDLFKVTFYFVPW